LKLQLEPVKFSLILKHKKCSTRITYSRLPRIRKESKRLRFYAPGNAINPTENKCAQPYTRLNAGSYFCSNTKRAEF